MKITIVRCFSDGNLEDLKFTIIINHYLFIYLMTHINFFFLTVISELENSYKRRKIAVAESEWSTLTGPRIMLVLTPLGHAALGSTFKF